jgi:hypothetical protein
MQQQQFQLKPQQHYQPSPLQPQQQLNQPNLTNVAISSLSHNNIPGESPLIFALSFFNPIVEYVRSLSHEILISMEISNGFCPLC